MNSIDVAPVSRDTNAAWDQWRTRLLAQWQPFADREADSSLYLLADARGNPGLDKLLMQVPGVKSSSLWRGSVIAAYADIAPYLIQVDPLALEQPRELAGRLFRRIWMEGQSRFMLTWIWTPLSLEALDSHLKYYTRYVTPDKREFFLHFYDNRILVRLRSVWTDAQAKSFIAPCHELWYCDRDFGESVWRNDEVTVQAHTDEVPQISADQQAQLYALGHADKLMMQLREMYGSRLDAPDEADFHRRVSAQLERASRYRLKDKDDFLNYVSKGIMLSPRFDEHPVIQERLRRALSGEISHREALTGFDRKVIQEVVKMDESHALQNA
ncbi:DUF4123 domain-containing protein [Caballeronia sp. LZ008]|uniref:DUF4123 domain-containing protein n=1 Tax=unclassified Caballeronia TaxID=2646786 RepID=UPI00202969E7|nr:MULTISPECIES: DUF4123 domain-containing protein [unclassified Caballeronia]MDR5795456.1 DUF4123 domain-containing protein [Caballeronia sp. LZ008]